MLAFFNTHEAFFFWITLIGSVGLIGSLIVVPWILIKIPSDYFYADKRKKCLWGHCPPMIRSLLLIIKNILGVLLVLSGIIMLFIPGQGMLTMIAGIVLMDFPYKYTMMRKIIKNSKILRFINRVRKKANQEPLKV